MIVSEPDLSAEAGPACVLGCLAVCLLLLLRTERASRVSGELHGCKPRGARGVCALRRAACQSSELFEPTHAMRQQKPVVCLKNKHSPMERKQTSCRGLSLQSLTSVQNKTKRKRDDAKECLKNANQENQNVKKQIIY